MTDLDAAPEAWWRDLDAAVMACLETRGAMAPHELGRASRMFSPYDVNPAGLNPLRPVLSRSVDFDRLETARGLSLRFASRIANLG